ncbi:hypothetical protein QF033_000790 [Bacillus pumilus]|nr:hypothetical protein [Bacillus pumilus]
MSGRRIVGAMFICMAALFYIAKYVLLEIRYSNSLIIQFSLDFHLSLT